VCAAASLHDVVTELASELLVDVRLNFAASGALCAQIERGAPCDVFLSADPLLIDRLVNGGRVKAGSRRVVAANRLVIARAGPGLMMTHELTTEAYARIAIADPDAAPAGRYARQALRAAGLWDALLPKLVRTPDVRSAARYLAMGAVQAAIVYATDAAAVQGITAAFLFDASSHEPIGYVGAVMQSSVDDAEASRFLNHVASARSAPIWRRHDFEPVPQRQPGENSK
jgi:molybdate transport system substrate-binding protein